MTDIPWIDQLRKHILVTERELRRALRQAKPDRRFARAGQQIIATTAGAGCGPTVTMGQHEARTLLRAAMPVPMLAPSTRHRHAEMLAALNSFAMRLHELNDPWAGPRVTAAALDLADTLHAWINAQRWAAATARAGTSWPEPISVMEITRQSPDTDVPAMFEGAPEKPRKEYTRKPAKPARQGTLLLPIASEAKPAADRKSAVPPCNKPSRKRQATA